jgi:hypothetical protein
MRSGRPSGSFILSLLPAPRAAQPEEAVADVKATAQSIVQRHMRLAESTSDPVLARRHLEAALAAQKLASGDIGHTGGGVSIVVEEAPLGATHDESDDAERSGEVQVEPAADASSAPVH